jgi:uncharacterized membrane protein YqiK
MPTNVLQLPYDPGPEGETAAERRKRISDKYEQYILNETPAPFRDPEMIQKLQADAAFEDRIQPTKMIDTEEIYDGTGGHHFAHKRVRPEMEGAFDGQFLKH